MLDGLLASVTLAILFVFAPLLAGLVLGGAVRYALLRWAMYTPLRHASAEAIVWGAKRDSHLLETLRGIKTIKLFNGQDSRRAHWLNLLVETVNRQLVTQRLRLMFKVANALLVGGLVILVLQGRSCGCADQCPGHRACLSESTLPGWNRPGGYAEALAVPQPCLRPVPDNIDDDLAALLLDTIGSAAHGLRTVQPQLPGAEDAAKQPQRVISSLRDIARPEFGIDLFKLERQCLTGYPRAALLPCHPAAQARRPRTRASSPAQPASISAQVPGSGTPLTAWVTISCTRSLAVS